MRHWTPQADYPFERATTPAGPGDRAISLSGLTMRLESMDAAADQFVAQRFQRYLPETIPAKPDLRLTFRLDPAAPYLRPRAAGGTLSGYQMEHAVIADILYHCSVTVCARLDLRSAAGIVLRRQVAGAAEREDPIHMAVENLLRSCLAWTVLQRGGFMLHAASVVREGRCYLFFGTSNAGKSTIASICGGQVISDDLTMVLPEGEGFVAIGSPFRGTYTACEDLTGRYPIAGAYRLIKDERVFIETRPAAIAFSDFVANLPFVVGELNRQPWAWQAIEAAFGRLKIRYLHFRKDPSFWDAIDAEEQRCKACSS
jgi:hypothetical protein